VNTPILDTLHLSVTDHLRRVAAMLLTCPESPVNDLAPDGQRLTVSA
jgi:hypothetical protein